jgi:hypothetical protein
VNAASREPAERGREHRPAHARGQGRRGAERDEARLLSRGALVRGESEADLVAFARRMRARLAPSGELELLLADRVVSSAWRLRRAVALEATLLGERDADRPGSPDPLVYRTARDRLLALSRHEAALERGLYKALHELRKLQADRGGEPVTVLDAEEVEASAAGAGEAA